LRKEKKGESLKVRRREKGGVSSEEKEYKVPVRPEREGREERKTKYEKKGESNGLFISMRGRERSPRDLYRGGREKSCPETHLHYREKKRKPVHV